MHQQPQSSEKSNYKGNDEIRLAVVCGPSDGDVSFKPGKYEEWNPFIGGQGASTCACRKGDFACSGEPDVSANILPRTVGYFVISPFSMANAVSDEALWRSSFFIRLARCFSTVLALMQR